MDAARRRKAEGRAEGQPRERADLLAELMRDVFGDDPRIADLAGRLAALPRAEAVTLALHTGSLDDLDAALPR